MKNINYNEIDEEMRGLVKALNESGYKTKFCCVGFNHDRMPFPYVIFDDNLTDEQAMELFNKIKTAETLVPVNLVKWVRTNGSEVFVNWKLDYGNFVYASNQTRDEIGDYNIIINDTDLIEAELLKKIAKEY